MKVLVVGGGGREHAIVDALTRSGRIDTIYCAPGNAGIAAQAECVPIRETEVEALRDFALAHNVTLTVVGPEAALAAGIVRCRVTAEAGFTGSVSTILGASGFAAGAAVYWAFSVWLPEPLTAALLTALLLRAIWVVRA